MNKIKNGIIIDGVVHVLVEDKGKDECSRCSLADICEIDIMHDGLCFYLNYGAIGHRFAKLVDCEHAEENNDNKS